jgi:hypothetical protein
MQNPSLPRSTVLEAAGQSDAARSLRRVLHNAPGSSERPEWTTRLLVDPSVPAGSREGDEWSAQSVSRARSLARSGLPP